MIISLIIPAEKELDRKFIEDRFEIRASASNKTTTYYEINDNEETLVYLKLKYGITAAWKK
jgi:hypothetical protein